jgi:hypothetical protein
MKEKLNESIENTKHLYRIRGVTNNCGAVATIVKSYELIDKDKNT